MLAKSGYEVVGQDVNAEAIDLARANPMFSNLPSQPTFLVADYENLPFAGEFDAVVFFDSLHHAIDMAAALRRVFRALTPGGIMIASEPGFGHAKQAREVMREFAVTDQDAPPSRTIALGRAAGFAQARIYPHAELLGPALYQPASAFGRILRLLHHTLLARRNGITVLIK
jgi:SAM-dependent methyltransferase